MMIIIIYIYHLEEISNHTDISILKHNNIDDFMIQYLL